MLSVSNLLCDHAAGNERLRYGHRDQAVPRPVVVWAVTRACNLRCVHCYASADPTPAPIELSHAEGRTLLDDLRGFGVPAVLISGGEPLMRPDTPQLIAYVQAIGLRCTLSTNGTLIDEPMADRLADLGLRRIAVRVDGECERHDKLRGMRGAFDRTLAAVDHCRDRNIAVGLQYTVHALNASELDAVFDLCLEHDVQRLCIYHLAYAGRAGAMMPVDLTAEQTRRIVDRIFERTHQCHRDGQTLEVVTAGNYADAAYLLLQLEQQDPDHAARIREHLEIVGGDGAGCSVAAIDALGDVHYDEFSTHYSCGNVRHRPFSRIWADPEDARLIVLRNRRNHLPPRCRDCRFLTVCNGNLRTRAEAAAGHWLADDPSCYLTDAEITGHAADRLTSASA